MAERKILTNWNLGQNEIQNARIHNLATAPSTPVLGQLYFDTVRNGMLNWNGSAWTLRATDSDALGGQAGSYYLNRANHTGTQLAATISNFMATVYTARLDQLANPTASVSMNSQLLTNVLAPVSGTDAANKNYVDTAVAGLSWKQPVRAATTANITLSATQTVDTVALAVGDRVLVKNQSTASQNGIYIVQSGAWTRAGDFDGSGTTGEVSTGNAVFVQSGGQAGSQWTLTTQGAITVGTTALTFAQFGGGLTYTAGNGLSLNATTFSVNAGNGLIADGTSLRLDPAIAARKFTQLIGDGTATSIGVAHGLGQQHVVGILVDATTNEQVEATIANTNSTTITYSFNSAPASGAYRAIVVG